jgi:hypothetical protein
MLKEKGCFRLLNFRQLLIDKCEQCGFVRKTKGVRLAYTKTKGAAGQIYISFGETQRVVKRLLLAAIYLRQPGIFENAISSEPITNLRNVAINAADRQAPTCPSKTNWFHPITSSHRLVPAHFAALVIGNHQVALATFALTT